MRITDRFATPLPGNRWLLVGKGTTSFGSLGYSGPCPPPTGETHHYLFLLYAIDKGQIGAAGLTFDAVVSALAGHVLGATSIIGTFHLPQ